MDGAQKEPRRFQLHLSTCVALMVVLGLLLGANIFAGGPNQSHVGAGWGWPIPVYAKSFFGGKVLQPAFLLVDLVIWFAISAGVVFVLELRARRERSDKEWSANHPDRDLG